MSKLKNSLAGRTILITGATYGIGEATARLMATRGASLILTARTTEKLETLRDEFTANGSRCEIFTADLYDMNGIEALTHFLESRRVDIFINNAGKSICRPISESLDRMGDFTRTISINYYAPVAITLCLLKHNNTLRVVNISTMNVLLPPTPYWAAYGASKTALNHWMASAEAELKDRLSVGNIYFALVATRMIAPTAAYASRRVMSVDRAARVVGMMAPSSRRSCRPYWGRAAECVAKIFRPLYCRGAMKIIDRG